MASTDKRHLCKGTRQLDAISKILAHEGVRCVLDLAPLRMMIHCTIKKGNAYFLVVTETWGIGTRVLVTLWRLWRGSQWRETQRRTTKAYDGCRSKNM